MKTPIYIAGQMREILEARAKSSSGLPLSYTDTRLLELAIELQLSIVEHASIPTLLSEMREEKQ